MAGRGRTRGHALPVLGLAALTLGLLTIGVGCAGTSEENTPSPTNLSGDGGDGSGSPTSGTAPQSDPSDGAGAQNDRAGQFADELAKSDNQKQNEAQFFLRQGNMFYAESDYERAAELYEKALELDSSLQEAKTKLVNSLMFLGKRDGEIKSVVQQLGDEIKVGREQRLTEVRRLLDQAESALAEGDSDDAVRNAGQAREQLLMYDYGSISTDDLSERAEEFRDIAEDRVRQIRDVSVARVARHEVLLPM